MLVVAWDAMDAAIPRLQAQEYMAAFTVQSVSSPYVAQDSRESILGVWRELVEKGIRVIKGSDRPTAERLPDGNTLRRHRVDMPLREVIRHIKGAFGREIWD